MLTSPITGKPSPVDATGHVSDMRASRNYKTRGAERGGRSSVWPNIPARPPPQCYRSIVRRIRQQAHANVGGRPPPNIYRGVSQPRLPILDGGEVGNTSQPDPFPTISIPGMGHGSVDAETIQGHPGSLHIEARNTDGGDPRVYNEFDATSAEKTPTLNFRGAPDDAPSHVSNALFMDRPLSPSNWPVGVQYA